MCETYCDFSVFLAENQRCEGGPHLTVGGGRAPSSRAGTQLAALRGQMDGWLMSIVRPTMAMGGPPVAPSYLEALPVSRPMPGTEPLEGIYEQNAQNSFKLN